MIKAKRPADSVGEQSESRYIIYGIKNCDKVRAAVKQCKLDGVSAQLHDFRVDGIDQSLVTAMLKDIDISQLLNKRSTTWKQLDDESKIEMDSALLVEYPTLIKRPVIFAAGHYRIGL
ncbi:FIG138056: a glutathione-dependent thiol reductase [hydrothermal vent metagenome]|uniref:FIG138056: a glutathione-dependent thiol reductase n=1 Tax=hydrothermal vent metagenome TaxID=652676 RepID=A0A3B0VJM4_9ZZZZ